MLRRWLLALLLGPLLGVSLGLYYNLTFFGAAAVPMPEPVSLLGPLLYYLSGGIRLQPSLQAAFWVIAFAVAELIWLGALELAARRRGFSPNLGVVASSALLLLPAPWMLYLHGTGPQGFSLGNCLEACLVRRFGLSPLSLQNATEGLSSIMLTLGCLAVLLATRQWYQAAGRQAGRAVVTWVGAALAALVMVVLLGNVLGGF